MYFGVLCLPGITGLVFGKEKVILQLRTKVVKHPNQALNGVEEVMH